MQGRLQDSERPHGLAAKRPHSNAPAIVVLDYDRPDLTNRAITSIRSTCDAVVIAVENGAGDSLARIDGADIRVQTDSNLGFAGGMNLGIIAARDAGSDVVILLNNDCIVSDGAIATLVDVLRKNRNIGLAAPSRRFSVGLLESESELGRAGDGNGSQSRSRTLRFVRRITGFCIAIRLDVLEKIGLLDTDFYFGKEDDELSARAVRFGYDLAEADWARVDHQVGSSTSLADPSQADFLLHHTARGTAILSRKLGESPIYSMPRLVLDTVRTSAKGLVNGNWHLVRMATAALRGYREGMTTGLHNTPRFDVNQ